MPDFCSTQQITTGSADSDADPDAYLQVRKRNIRRTLWALKENNDTRFQKFDLPDTIPYGKIN
jgi:hypothetical protein